MFANTIIYVDTSTHINVGVKSLIPSVLVGPGMRQHGPAESISKRALFTLRHVSVRILPKRSGENTSAMTRREKPGVQIAPQSGTGDKRLVFSRLDSGICGGGI
jgi:hypothetical protein